MFSFLVLAVLMYKFSQSVIVRVVENSFPLKLILNKNENNFKCIAIWILRKSLKTFCKVMLKLLKRDEEKFQFQILS